MHESILGITLGVVALLGGGTGILLILSKSSLLRFCLAILGVIAIAAIVWYFPSEFVLSVRTAEYEFQTAAAGEEIFFNLEEGEYSVATQPQRVTLNGEKYVETWLGGEAACVYIPANQWKGVIEEARLVRIANLPDNPYDDKPPERLAYGEE